MTAYRLPWKAIFVKNSNPAGRVRKDAPAAGQAGEQEFFHPKIPKRRHFFGQINKISIMFFLENPSGNFSQDSACRKIKQIFFGRNG
ncbi:MAG: hypothetical protein ACLP7A_09685 [Desulfobaccales bacterium]